MALRQNAHRIALFSLLLVSAVTLCLSGCLKMKMDFVVYPDSSGKVDLAGGMNKSFAELGEGGEGPMDDFDLVKGCNSVEEVLQKMDERGVYATTFPVEKYEEGDFKMTRVTWYFKDANKLILEESKEGEDGEKTTAPKLAFGPREDAEGWRLGLVEAVPGLGEEEIEELKNQSDEEFEMQMGFMGAVLAVFDISQSYCMPGEIEKVVEPMTCEGRRASLNLDGAAMKEMIVQAREAAKQGEPPPFAGATELLCGPATAEVELEHHAFLEEMEAAREKLIQALEDHFAGEEGGR